MDLLTRDALILITAKAAETAQMSPESYLRRYFKNGNDREQAEQFLHLMHIIYTKWEKVPVWSDRWSLDNQTQEVLKWYSED